ncbi:MAG TPA: hypothetical protein VIR57_16145 [Chloroflexota bacterium]|jgi:hypothetical protein
MSVYSIHKIAHLVQKDPDFRDRMRAGPAEAIEDFPLTDEERRLLLAGEVGKLERLGAHGYVLGALARHKVLDLDQEKYIERMHQG